MKPANKLPPVAQVSVAPTNLYTPANLGLLWQSFIAFKQQLEQLTAGCLAPGAIPVISNRIATNLPLGYNWILPFAYGFSSDSRYVDLYPGMTLIVDYGSYQYLGPATVAAGKRNAYAGVGTSRFRLRRRSDGTVGFNAFMDVARSFGVTFASPNQVAGLCDLEAAGATANYVRLIYPSSMSNTTDTSSLPSATQNPVLLFASSIVNLEKATGNYVTNGDPGSEGTVVFFSGRAAIYPEINITLNGVATPIPIGTTLADVAATQLNLSIIDNWGSAAGAAVSMARWSQNMTNQNNPPFNVLTSVPLTIQGSISSSTGLSQWDMPLLAGDSVQWTTSLT